jgi:hypothetical protein
MAKNVEYEYSFMHLSVIYNSSFEKCLFSSFAHLLIVLFLFWYSIFECLYILDINPLSDDCLANFFSHSAEDLKLDAISFVDFCSCFLRYWNPFHKVLAYAYLSMSSCMFTSSNFKVSSLILRFLTHFEFIFCTGQEMEI